MNRPAAISIGIVIVILGGLGAWLWLGGEEPASEPAPDPVLRPESLQPAGPAPGPDVDLPPLDESDPFLRERLRLLSSHPRLAEVLGNDRLVRRFVAVVDNVASGASPRRHLEFLEPEDEFDVIERDGTAYIDPDSYRRYDWVATLVSSIDAGEAARLYPQLEPLFRRAYRDLGHPEGDFRAALGRAIERLLQTPLPPGDIELQRGVLRWELADPRLESLSPAAKHLLRMGPTNGGLVQAKLRELAAALGA